MRKIKSKAYLMKTVALYVVIGFAMVVILFPIYWTFTTAFKAPKDAFTYPPRLIPYFHFKPTLYAWKDIGIVPRKVGELVKGLEEGMPTHGTWQILYYMKNSLIAAVGSTLVALLLGCTAAYGLVRYRFRIWKNKDIAFFVLAQRMLPPIALLIPFFILFRQLKMLDTLHGLIVAHSVINIPFVVWIMREFFSEIPKELTDAALVDGASEIGAFLRVIFPLSIPGVMATTIFCLLFSWNELLLAVTLTFGNARTLPALIAGLTVVGAPLWWDISAMISLAMIPPLILVFVVQKHIVRGLTLGAIK